MVDERNEPDNDEQVQSVHIEECVKPHVDQDACWLKKGCRSYYGYKCHRSTDENGLILAKVTTLANESDITNLNNPLDKTRFT